MFLCRFAWVALFLIPAVGCSGAPPTGAVEGEITLADGTPLPSGVIHFIPLDIPEARPVFARIENGKYQLAAPAGPAVGKHRIELSAYRKSKQGEVQEEGGKKVTVFPEEQYLPAAYNLESRHFVEIVSGVNRKDMKLEVK